MTDKNKLMEIICHTSCPVHYAYMDYCPNCGAKMG